MAPVPSQRKSSKTREPGARPTARVLRPAQIAAAIERMAAPSGTARFAAGKALCQTAERDPQRVYPHIERLAALLDSESKIIRWVAIRALGLLAAADSQHRLDRYLDTYLRLVTGCELIAAANAIQGAGLIAKARPDLRERVIDTLLSVERARYETPECRNVAIGKVLAVLREFGPAARRRPDVARFIQRQRRNSRAAVARLAERIHAESAARD